MLFKLSLKNIKKSIKDYSVYFFTLVFAVCMFYMFNSIDAQTSVIKLTNSKYEIVQLLIQLLNYISVFVSIILGFLIVYSNNFLIKRRKKEIGLYFTLGMSKKKVSMIIVLETIFIGLISLFVGLLVGIGLSQFVSVFIAKLFEADMTGLKFVFSVGAFSKTILYFAVIFLLVMVFNVITLSRYKLINLLNAGRKNEQIKIRNKYMTIITFALSVLFLGYAYYLLFNNVLLLMNYKIVVMLISGTIGTFLLFYSLSGFIIKLFQKFGKLYYKNLNIFTLKQVDSKINTTVVSTTVICIMLLLTIGILSSSLSLAGIFNDDLNANNLTDYTIKIYDDTDRTAELTNNSKFNKYSNDYAIVHIYNEEDFIVKDLLTDYSIDKLVKEYGSALSFNFPVPVISESEYKKIMSVQGNDIVSLKDGEYLLLGNITFINDAYKDFYETKQTKITLNKQNLVPATKKIEEVPIGNSASNNNDGIVVVKDDLVANMSISMSYLIGNYSSSNIDEELDDNFYDFVRDNFDGEYSMATGISMRTSSVGVKAIVIFVGLYLGITFAISSATVIAIGQLSESSDNKLRYKILKQLGADNKMINKALFTQILIVFLFPLIVALVHSYFGLKEINSMIISIGNIDLTSNIIITTLFMLFVYGGYFMITYFCSKNIIKSE